MLRLTPYALLLATCGLTTEQAAFVHKVRPDTVRSWSTGRRNAPPGALDELRDLHDRIQGVADNLIQHLEDIDVPESQPLEIALCTTDAEATARGLPFAACHQMAIAYALTVIINPVSLAPVSESMTALATVRPEGSA